MNKINCQELFHKQQASPIIHYTILFLQLNALKFQKIKIFTCCRHKSFIPFTCHIIEQDIIAHKSARRLDFHIFRFAMHYMPFLVDLKINYFHSSVDVETYFHPE